MLNIDHSCENCPFNVPVCGYKGHLEGKIVILGESPGAEEKREGLPFVGPSGQVLHEVMGMVPYWESQLRQEDYLLLNVHRCVPYKEAVQIQKTQATEACAASTMELIQSAPRRLIVALGNVALHFVTGDNTLKITQARGKIHAVRESLADTVELGVLPVVHPAALLRGTGSFRQFKRDIALATKLFYSEPEPYVKPKFKIVDMSDNETVAEAFQTLDAAEKLTGDIETTGLDFTSDHILSVGICADGESTVYCFGPEWFPARRFKELFTRGKWCWHNGKFDVKFLRQRWGIEARVDDDTMLMSYALDENRGVHGLEVVGSDYINAPDYKFMVKPYIQSKKDTYANIPTDVLMDYMSIDVGNTARLRTVLGDLVATEKSASKLYKKTLIPASEALSRIEMNGIYVDVQRVEDNVATLEAEVDELREEIQNIAGYAVNPSSPQQMAVVLFDEMGLQRNRDRSTNVQFLEKMPQVPIVVALQKYRKAVKMLGTYARGMYKWIRPDSRIYPTFNIHGTRTGRLSSSDPNLQNIPRDPRFRGMFVSTPGYTLLEVDLSQAELRCLALLSGDEVMQEVYTTGGDLHSELATALFPDWRARYDSEDPDVRQEAYEQRVRCKNINFGVIYGITEQGLARQMELSVEECKKYLIGWGRRFAQAKRFIDRCRAVPAQGQSITTVFGRVKRAGLVTTANLQHMQNEAANFPHQSIASDITLHTTIKVEPRLRAHGVRIVNTVHDSIIMEVPDHGRADVKDTARYVKRAMEKTPVEWGLTAIPFVADAESGYRWGSLEKLEI